MADLKPAKEMTSTEIAAELPQRDRELGDYLTMLEESGGHSGSPGEWLVERMGELKTEQERRQAGVAGTTETCDTTESRLNPLTTPDAEPPRLDQT